MVLAAEGRKANDSHADCYQYFCVPEYGTANGRLHFHVVFFLQAEDGIRDVAVTGVQTCALPIWRRCPMMKKAVILVLAIMVSVTCSPARTQAPRPARKHKNPPPTPNTVDPQLVDKLAAAKKPAVGQPLVIEGSTVCGPRGNAADTKMQELNNNKNRTDEPADGDLIPISWDDLNNLPADRVNDIQGAPVSVVGYLSIRVKQQTGAPGETTNCNLLNPDEVDWHMYLTKGPRQPINTAIIVETTPRVRPNHKWTTQMVAAYVNQMKQLRISGWLMYDFQHLDVVGRDRGTVWEVHPITKIEVQDQAGNWANLEQ